MTAHQYIEVDPSELARAAEEAAERQERATVEQEWLKQARPWQPTTEAEAQKEAASSKPAPAAHLVDDEQHLTFGDLAEGALRLLVACAAHGGVGVLADNFSVGVCLRAVRDLHEQAAAMARDDADAT